MSATPDASLLLYEPMSPYRYQGSVEKSCEPKSDITPKSPRERQNDRASVYPIAPFKKGHSQYIHLWMPFIFKLKHTLSYLFATFSVSGYMIESVKGRDIKIFALRRANVAHRFCGAKNFCESIKNPNPKTREGIARYRVPDKDMSICIIFAILLAESR